MRIEILIYTVTWVICYFIIQQNYARRLRFLTNSGQNDNIEFAKNKISYASMVAVTLLWVLFNAYITSTHPITGGDRMNYLVNFAGQRETPSLGLSWMIAAVKAFGGNMNVLFYLTTFICIFMTMLAYKYSVDATPKSMLLLFLTQYGYITLTALKQSYTNAFATLALTILIQKHTKKENYICLFLILLSCVFHPTGYILMPLYFVLVANRSKRGITLYAIAIIVIAFFFQPLMLVLARILSPIVPSLGTKIYQYFNEAASESGESLSMSFIKGLPIYLISILGLIKRKHLVNIIDAYDKYLIICLTGSFLYLMSIYNDWMYRFIYLFYFPIFVFYSLIIKNLTIKTNRMIIDPVICVGLAVVLYRFLFIVFR